MFKMSMPPIEEKQPQLRFTGLWIPAEIIEMQDLSIIEKYALATIDALDGPDHCFASNAYLAEKCEVSIDRMSHIITKLKKLLLIEQVSFDGRKRVLKSLKKNWFDRGKKQKSKKESLVLKPSHPSYKNLVRPVKNNEYIVKDIEKNNLPLSSPSKDEPVESVSEISLRSEEEDSLQRELNKTSLSPKEKDRLRKEFEPPEILRAIEISKTESIKKTLMALLLTILRNPQDWQKSSKAEQLTVQDQKALQYNEILYKLDKKTAEENVENIKSNKLLKTHIRYKVGDKVVNETISLKDINCISEIEVSINRLESILREMKKQ